MVLRYCAAMRGGISAARARAGPAALSSSKGPENCRCAADCASWAVCPRASPLNHRFAFPRAAASDPHRGFGPGARAPAARRRRGHARPRIFPVALRWWRRRAARAGWVCAPVCRWPAPCRPRSDVWRPSESLPGGHTRAIYRRAGPSRVRP